MSLMRYNNPWNLFDALQRDLYNLDRPQGRNQLDDEANVATASWAPKHQYDPQLSAFEQPNAARRVFQGLRTAL